ncbi:MAG: hypothetical protein KDG50_06425 [Chromatiales bacterium]|nr:hypothetical protein [Chromatiales bacterium]
MRFAPAALSAGLALAAGCGRPPPAVEIRLDGVPDLSQHDPALGDAARAENLCAPVAVSDSLAWLAGDTDRARQIALARRLADLMGTSPHAGTPPAGLVAGVERHLREVGTPIARLEYAGFRPVATRHRSRAVLGLDWIVAGLGPRRAVWLNVGWYRSPSPGYYRRIGGHWVVAVGYRDGRLAIHDPGPWADAGADPQTLKARELRALVFEFEGSFDYPGPLLIELRNARTPTPGVRAFIDGAVLLETAERPP